MKDIHQELLEMGHVARNIVNAHHRQTKEPLNLFFVDLEPADNNKDVYNITALQNKNHPHRTTAGEQETRSTMRQMPTVWTH